MIFLRDVTDSKNTEKECRAMLKQNIAMDQLYSGSNQDCRAFCSL